VWVIFGIDEKLWACQRSKELRAMGLNLTAGGATAYLTMD